MVSADTRNNYTQMQKLFAEWPVSIPRAGVVVTAFGETIQFREFMISGDLLLVERVTPDIVGARRVIMEFSQISAVKILDAIELARFTAFGFRGPMAVRQ